MGRNRTVVLSRVLLAALAFPSARAAAQSATDLPDVRNIRPVVMLLVDTSGSMERKPIPTSGSCGDCKPVCSGTPFSDQSQKNRWAITLEALTGTFDEFRCYERDRSGSGFTTADYDYGYFLPHYDFFGTGGETSSTQLSDGLIDTFDNIAKFGLMTFDGVGTTIGGDTLVPLTPTWADPDFLALANGAPGMYSYGRIGKLSFPGCTDEYGFNAGARGPAPASETVPGALISASLSDDSTDVSSVNASIEASLRLVRPFGGTPIAAMLDDLEYYFDNDTNVKAGSDRYYTCRERFAVLLTDGAPDKLFDDTRFQCRTPGVGSPGKLCAGSGCSCPYDTEEQIAGRMVDRGLLSALFLVGYNVDDRAALETLDRIAKAGNSDKALEAATADALRTRLREIMNYAAPAATSRSVPVSVQTSLVNGNTYQITSGFQVGETASDPWYGILNRRPITCDGSSPVSNTALTDDDRFDVQLNRQVTRNVFTAPPANRAEARGTLYASYDPTPVSNTETGLIMAADLDGSSLAVTSTRNLNRAHYSALTDTAPTDDATLTEARGLGQALETPNIAQSAFTATGAAALDPLLFSGTGTADVPGIVSYVLGLSGPRATHKLGDIFHSNPVVMNPVTATEARYLTSDTGYANWLRTLAGKYDSGPTPGERPGVVFVGTNDGILHAFNLQSWASAPTGFPGEWYKDNALKAGVELWGFVPPSLYNKMETMITPTHQWMFDGTPVVKDVVLYRDAGAGSRALYRTVLISAVRGAPSFVALDVTFPEQPQFMWQRSFPGLGNTVGQPALAQVNINWDGSGIQQRAVAILPGGGGLLSGSGPCGVQSGDLEALAPNADARTQVRCWQQRGRSLYVVDVASGKLIQEFDSRHFPAPLTGAISVDGLGTAVSRAAYFSDADGVLWRLSMVSGDPTEWVVMPIFDMFHGAAYNAGRAATYAPVLSRDPSGNLVIAAGTGDLDNLTDTAAHRVVSLTERRAILAGTTIEIGDVSVGGVEAPGINWELPLEAGESVTGPLALFEDTLYFGTFTSPTGSSGDACQVGTSRIYGAHVREPESATATAKRPRPMLFEPGDPNRSDDDTWVLSEVVDSTGTSLVLGLSISRQPVCSIGNYIPNATSGISNFAPTAASGGGAFELHALVGGGTNRTEGSSKVGGSQLREFKRQLQVVTEVSAVGFAGAVE